MKTLFLATIMSITVSTICIGADMGKYQSISEVPVGTWQKLADTKIFFGHQSVGNNILDGLDDVMKRNPQIKLNVVETTDLASLESSFFAHARIGKNRDAKSKIDAFSGTLDTEPGHKADVAFLKFCYADANETTDVDKVFEDYQQAVTSLKEKHPELVLIHMTIPLTIVQTGIKAYIKKAIGRSVDGYDKNIKREQLSEKIRAAYGDKEPLLDIAQIESTFPDGSRSSFSQDDKTYYSLVPDYTFDGAHLNEQGRRLVAEQLLVLLASVVD